MHTERETYIRVVDLDDIFGAAGLSGRAMGQEPRSCCAPSAYLRASDTARGEEIGRVDYWG